MTREEEKLKAADEYVKSRIKQGQGMTGDVFPAFIEGIEWADANPDGKMLLHVLNKSAEQTKKQMIDRACEWLNAFLASHYVMRYHDNCEPVKEYVLEGFRRAMEE